MSDLSHYHKLVERALQGVLRNILEEVGEVGLKGNQHFYITFRTDFPGVEVPSYLRERYPEEMTIVLQYQFWSLEVDDEAFSVTLSFNDVLERLFVPMDAVTAFVDPAVKFMLPLRFRPPEQANDGEAEPLAADSDEEPTLEANLPAKAPAAQLPAKTITKTRRASKAKKAKAAKPAEEQTVGESANVVTLDSFRNKTS